MTTGMPTPGPAPGPATAPDVIPLRVPDLGPDERWMTMQPAVSPSAAPYRHIIAAGRGTSVCGITAIPAELWRPNRDLPACPDCARRYLTGTPHDPANDARLVVQRRRDTASGGVTVSEHRYPSAAERTHLQRDLVASSLPPEHAEHAAALSALVAAGLLTLDVSKRNVDASGPYQDSDGMALRGHDPATVRTQTRLVLRTEWRDPVPEQAPQQASGEAPAGAVS